MGRSGWWELTENGASHGEGLWVVSQLALPPIGMEGQLGMGPPGGGRGPGKLPAALQPPSANMLAAVGIIATHRSVRDSWLFIRIDSTEQPSSSCRKNGCAGEARENKFSYTEQPREALPVSNPPTPGPAQRPL